MVIQALAERVKESGFNPLLMATVAEPIKNLEAWQSHHNVKVVLNNQDEALYFSRAAIGGEQALDMTLPPICHHIGLYGYYAAFLKHYMLWPESALEHSERLEQLRALVNGATMPVIRVAPQIGIGVDTQDDYDAVCAYLKKRNDA
jgi:3-deoxy-manno-octulosonate cytidylyltransferase (CMP-KDO synthetase)